MGRQGKNKYYSTSRKLRIAGKTSEEFEAMLANLSLEEIIALKLEISAKVINNKLYGFDLWKAVPRIARDSVLKFVYSATQSKSDASRVLGIKQAEFSKLLKIYEIESYFNDEE
tara:strand:+ start:465 stop:806 length:342 start_codon:yes stop_codon:yes gene_type:complete